MACDQLLAAVIVPRRVEVANISVFHVDDRLDGALVFVFLSPEIFFHPMRQRRPKIGCGQPFRALLLISPLAIGVLLICDLLRGSARLVLGQEKLVLIPMPIVLGLVSDACIARLLALPSFDAPNGRPLHLRDGVVNLIRRQVAMRAIVATLAGNLEFQVGAGDDPPLPCTRAIRARDFQPL